MRELVIDTDTGSDDAIAILMALAHPDVEVLAVTTVAGNVELDQATRNCCIALDIAGSRDVPVHRGCDRPLVRPLETAVEVHGSDGLGDTHLGDPGIIPESAHAIEALVHLANERPGERTLVALGPLTNVAVALAVDPDLLAKFDRTVIMGGAPDVVGNVSDMAEFNAWADPEAAAKVFAAPGDKVMVGWNVAMAHSQIDSTSRRRMAELGTISGQFAHDVTSVVEAFCHERLGLSFFALPDPIAMAIALDPAIATRVQSVGINVGLAEDSRGVTFPSYLNHHPAPTDVVWEADHDGFEAMLFDALAALR